MIDIYAFFRIKTYNNASDSTSCNPSKRIKVISEGKI